MGIGTLLWPDDEPMSARQQWLLGHQPKGRVVLDDGAISVIRQEGSSILSVGVILVEGDFSRGELVVCCDQSGKEVARGLVNYNYDEASRLMGRASHEIEQILGYVDAEELIHRDNLVVTS